MNSFLNNLNMKSGHLISLLIIFYVCVTGTTYMFNYTDLMREYYLLCGPDYFCLPPEKTHQWDISPNLSYRHLYVCPECQCDYACITRGDCCADLYFSFPELNCVNRTIINGKYDKNKRDQYSALMVTSCPDESNRDVNEKCISLIDTKSRLQNYPVTGTGTPLTFYNKYCAECHNVLNHTTWTLDIDCSLFADFNFLSTLDEVIDMAFKKKCIFQAYRKDDKLYDTKEENCFDIDGSHTIMTQCNQTGEWMVYDQNIAYACESYFKGQYRLFKNVYCYICNPSGQRFMTLTFTTCNVTGQWKTFDSGLQQACAYLPMTLSTLPFKNIFCYLCNRGNDSSQLFVDILGELKEFPIDDSYFHYQYNLSIVDFNVDYFIHNSQQRIAKEKELGDMIYTPFDVSSFRLNNGTLINMTNLLLQNAAISPENVYVCESRRSTFLMGYDSSQCICESSCFFKPWAWRECCADLALQIPMHCRDILDLSHASLPRSEKKGFLTINGCFQESTRKLIKLGCSFPDKNDIFSTVPMDNADGITYDNFYCTLCNFESDVLLKKLQSHVEISNQSRNWMSKQKDDFIFKYMELYQKVKDQYTIWNLEMVCPKYLDYSHYLTAGDLVEIAKQIKCRIQFKTQIEGSRYCYPGGRTQARCVDRQEWTYSDPDIKWACENVITYRKWWASNLPKDVPKEFDLDPQKHYRKTNLYSSILCALCKPKSTFSEFFIDNCTINDSADECFFFPRIYYYYPFKNLHCVSCNDLIVTTELSPDSEKELDSYNRIVGVNWFPLLRNLFSISEDEVIEDETTTGQCRNNQIYDNFQGVCRSITCYSGKFFDGINCKPLMAITMNLKYTIRIEIGFYTIKEPVLQVFYPMDIGDVEKELDTYIRFAKGHSQIDLGDYEEFDGGPGVSEAYCLTIIFDILFQSSVSRILVEESLITVKNRLQGGCQQNITSLNSTVRKDKSIHMKKRSVMEGPDRYYSAKVSNALLCPQIELEDDEYNINGDKSVLSLTRDGFDEVVFDQFATTPNGKMRVCLEYLQDINYLPPHQHKAGSVLLDLRQKYLWVLSLVSSIVSITSLILGLIIYSLFPSLRTIPGKLLMMMMVSLLFTLLFLQISIFVVQTKYGCFVVAAVLHFSWLSVFTCMQTSNFHMWRTFTSSGLRTYTPGRTLFKYSFYNFGVPICSVLFNVVLARLIHSDSFGGYGGSKCFIKDVYLLVAVFISPVFLICFLNIVLFSFTVHSIKMTPSAANNQRKRNELAIFARLASITGLSWLLQIIDSFLPVTYFTFFATIINSLQGLFMFIAFLVNRRVWGLLCSKFCHKQSEKRPTTNTVSQSNTMQSTHSNDITPTSHREQSNESQENAKNNQTSELTFQSLLEMFQNKCVDWTEVALENIAIQSDKRSYDLQNKECIDTSL